MIFFQTVGALLGLIVSAYLIWLGLGKTISFFNSDGYYQSNNLDYKSLVFGVILAIIGAILTSIALIAVPNNLYSRLIVSVAGVIVFIIGYYQIQVEGDSQRGRYWGWTLITIYAIFSSAYLIALVIADGITFIKGLF